MQKIKTLLEAICEPLKISFAFLETFCFFLKTRFRKETNQISFDSRFLVTVKTVDLEMMYKLKSLILKTLDFL
jgi:hypothetical protein